MFVCLLLFLGGGHWNYCVNLSLCLYLLNEQPFLARLGVVVHHHELECNAKQNKQNGGMLSSRSRSQ